MNGMKAKAARRQHRKRLTEDGIPRDANDWLYEDWQDLHWALEWVKRRIAERHKEAEHG